MAEQKRMKHYYFELDADHAGYLASLIERHAKKMEINTMVELYRAVLKRKVTLEQIKKLEELEELE